MFIYSVKVKEPGVNVSMLNLSVFIKKMYYMVRHMWARFLSYCDIANRNTDSEFQRVFKAFSNMLTHILNAGDEGIMQGSQ